MTLITPQILSLVVTALRNDIWVVNTGRVFDTRKREPLMVTPSSSTMLKDRAEKMSTTAFDAEHKVYYGSHRLEMARGPGFRLT